MPSRSCSGLLLSVVVLVCGVLGTPAFAAPSNGLPSCTPQNSVDGVTASIADLNADGYSDVVVGVPDASVSGLARAGVEDIHYWHVSDGLSSQRLSEAYFGETTAADDDFGASTAYTEASAQFGCYGLAIGAPGADSGHGRVTLTHGTNSGISPDDAMVLTGAHPGDRFGSVVVSSQTGDVWVGAPDASVDGHAGAGAVYHYALDPTTRAPRLVEVITENSPHVPGSAGTGDHFGQALSADQNDIAVGVPGKSVDGAAGAGEIALLRAGTDADTLVGGATETQDSPGVPGKSEAGDSFGSSVSLNGTLAVGVPGEDIGTIRNAGAVQVLNDDYPKHSGGPVVRIGIGQAITQETPTVSGGSETGDRFGAAVQLSAPPEGDINAYLSIGAPGESIGDIRTSGDVIPLEESAKGRWRQNGPAIRLGAGGLPGKPQTAAHVGASLGLFSASDDYDEGIIGGESVIIDAPGVDDTSAHAGEIHVGDGVGGSGVYQDSAGPHSSEWYGIAASNWSNGPYDD